MRRALLPSILGVVLLAACGQHAGVRAEARVLRRIAEAAPAAQRLQPVTRAATPPGEPARSPGTTPSPVTVPAPEEGADFVTWPQWATMLLPRLGAPVCMNNVVSVVAWAAQEGTTAGWNPLATTFEMPGSTRFNSHGVQNYVSLEQGLDATVLTIQGGWSVHGYGAIVEALQRCAPAMETAEAIRASNWCADCAEGRYVTGVVRAIRAALRGTG